MAIISNYPLAGVVNTNKRRKQQNGQFIDTGNIGHTIQWSKKNKTQKTEKTSNRDPPKPKFG